MTRPAVFTQGDVSKLLKGARAAGYTVSRIEIDLSGKIVASFGAATDDADPMAKHNEWDEVLPDAEEERPARQRHRV